MLSVPFTQLISPTRSSITQTASVARQWLHVLPRETAKQPLANFVTGFWSALNTFQGRCCARSRTCEPDMFLKCMWNFQICSCWQIRLRMHFRVNICSLSIEVCNTVLSPVSSSWKFLYNQLFSRSFHEELCGILKCTGGIAFTSCNIHHEQVEKIETSHIVYIVSDNQGCSSQVWPSFLSMIYLLFYYFTNLMLLVVLLFCRSCLLLLLVPCSRPESLLSYQFHTESQTLFIITQTVLHDNFRPISKGFGQDLCSFWTALHLRTQDSIPIVGTVLCLLQHVALWRHHNLSITLTLKCFNMEDLKCQNNKLK